MGEHLGCSPCGKVAYAVATELRVWRPGPEVLLSLLLVSLELYREIVELQFDLAMPVTVLASSSRRRACKSR